MTVNSSNFRHYGKVGTKTNLLSPSKVKGMLKERVEVLRKSRSTDRFTPNLADRLTVVSILTRLKTLKPSNYQALTRRTSVWVKQKFGELCVVGSDLISLFP